MSLTTKLEDIIGDIDALQLSWRRERHSRHSYADLEDISRLPTRMIPMRVPAY
jgi:hypothetical protein